MEGTARDDAVRRPGLWAGIGHVFFELSQTRYNVGVTFWKRPKNEAPTDFYKLGFSAAMAEPAFAFCWLLSSGI